MSIESREDFLAHYGVPGMRWGRRKSSSRVDLISKSTGEKLAINYDPKKAKISLKENGEVRITTNSKREDRSIQRQIDKVQVKLLSDTELRSAINRIQMEQQYAQLTGSKSVSAGKKAVTDILANSAKQVASEFVKQGIKSGVEAAIKAATKAKS